MNERELLERLESLTAEKVDALNRANFLHGRAEECKFLLDKIRAEKKPGLSLVSGDGPEPPDPEAETETAP